MPLKGLQDALGRIKALKTQYAPLFERFKAFKPLWHFLEGCRGSELLWNGAIEIGSKQNKEYPMMKHNYQVWRCKKCQEPFIKWADIVEASQSIETSIEDHVPEVKKKVKPLGRSESGLGLME